MLEDDSIMKNSLLRIIHLGMFLLVLGLSGAGAQFSVSITIGGIALHQGKSENNRFYKCKIDRSGRAIFFTGIALGASYRINDYFGIKAFQSFILHDSAGKRAGISHIGLELHDDLVGMKGQKHQFSTSIGPFWYYRKGWMGIPEYQNDPQFIKLSNDGRWERKFIWYGGFFRYNLQLDDCNDLAIEFLPGYPHIYALSAGWNRN